MGSITSANARLALTVPSVFSSPQLIKGFSADDAFTQAPVTIGMAKIGVDGVKSSAFLPNIREFTITLQPDSPSILVFDNWIGACKAAQELFPGTLLATLAAVGKAYTITQCTLRDVMELPPVKRSLDPQIYVLDVLDVIASPA